MTDRFRLTKPAIKDIEEIADYIAQQSGLEPIDPCCLTNPTGEKLMSDPDENFSLPSNQDRQKVTGSNLNILDLQWELLMSEGGYWDAEKVVQMLGLESIESFDKLREECEIIGLWWQEQYLYPAWQFIEGGQILAGLPQILKHLNNTHSDWEKLFFLLSPNLRLDDEKMPLDELRTGNIDAVILATTG
jgi:hypothetical protein